MTQADPKSQLHRYLKHAREAVLWKLDGLSEYDIRRPMTPTGTNLLGLVKHVASVEAGYLARPSGDPFPNRCRGTRTVPSPTPTCGPGPGSHVTRSSTSTDGCGHI